MTTEYSGTILHTDTASILEVQRARDRFEQAWQDLASPDAIVELAEFLPEPGSPTRVLVLRALLPLDLDARWRRGHPSLIERYLEHYPELGSASTIPVSIVVAEYLARNQYGDAPPVEEYASRFPQALAELRKAKAEKTVPVDPMTGTVTLARQASEYLITISLPPAPTAGTPTVERGGSGLTGLPSDAGFAAGTNLAPPDQGYKLGEKLGAGAFGEVRKAEAPGGVDVAMKIIFRPLSHAAAQQELRSLDLIKKLRHPYLLQTHAYWSLQDRLMIVMEMADGSLKDRKVQCIADKLPGIPVEELLLYMRESAEAIDYLHTQGIQHRDIKPANLLLLGTHVKLADFGLAQLRPTSDNAGEGDRSGTPGFMAPEVWQGNAGPEADQYALAVTYVELRLGRLPFPGRSMVEQMTAHMTMTPDLTGLEPAEEVVVGRALAKKAENRFESCAVFISALITALAPPPPPPPPPPPRWKRYSLIGVTVAAVLAAGAVALFRPEPEPPPPWLPADARPADGSVATKIGDRLLYDRFVLQRGGEEIPFTLIAPSDVVPDQPYYIMQNKVWNGLFAAAWKDPAYQKELAALAANAEWVTQDVWRKGGEKNEEDLGIADPNLPVFRVTVTEAYCCARWLGGQLPFREQWLKAAGKDGTEKRPTPAIPGCTDGIAVGRFQKGPAPVGSSDCDISPYGIRDMAGNGMEWTRAILDPIGNPFVPMPQPRRDIAVLILGASYTEAEPYSFPETELDLLKTRSETYDRASPRIGFRVVIEP